MTKPKSDTAAAAPKQVRHVYVMIDENHKLTLYSDPAGRTEMTNLTPLHVPDGKRNGHVQFSFIGDPTPGQHGAFIETADLIIIPQTVPDPTATYGRRKDSPFHPNNQRTWILPDPAAPNDPGNWMGSMRPGSDGAIPVGNPIKVKDVDEISLLYKYAIVALCDGGVEFTSVDPTIRIEP